MEQRNSNNSRDRRPNEVNDPIAREVARLELVDDLAHDSNISANLIDNKEQLAAEQRVNEAFSSFSRKSKQVFKK